MTSERVVVGDSEQRVDGAAVAQIDLWRLDEALSSDNPIIQSFAVLDKRLGKRRLKLMDRSTLHPLVVKLLDLRLECEQVNQSDSLS